MIGTGNNELIVAVVLLALSGIVFFQVCLNGM